MVAIEMKNGFDALNPANSTSPLDVRSTCPHGRFLVILCLPSIAACTDVESWHCPREILGPVSSDSPNLAPR